MIKKNTEQKVEIQPEEAVVQRVGRRHLAEAIQAKIKACGKAVPLSIAEIMVVAYEEAVAEALTSGTEVNLPGFGKFMVRDKEETTGRNPSSGEQITISARKVVRFKVGAALKKAVNGGIDLEGDED